MKKNNKLKIGITMGDPSGIGPAIIAKALPKVKGLAEFTIIGDAGVYNKISHQLSAVSYQPSAISMCVT